MAGLVNGVVTVTTIKFQLANMQLVTVRNRLFGSVPDVDNFGMTPGKQASCQIPSDCQTPSPLTLAMTLRTPPCSPGEKLSTSSVHPFRAASF